MVSRNKALLVLSHCVVIIVALSKIQPAGGQLVLCQSFAQTYVSYLEQCSKKV